MVIILRIWIEYRSCFLTFNIRLMYHLDTPNQNKNTQGTVELLVLEISFDNSSGCSIHKASC